MLALSCTCAVGSWTIWLGGHRMPPRRPRRAAVGQVRADHDELVATEAAEDIVRAKAGLEPARHRHQDLVTGAATEPVVDHLQVVEVDEEDGELVLTASSLVPLCVRQQFHDRQAGWAGR